MQYFKLNNSGFVTNFLVTSLIEKDIVTNISSDDQLEFERLVRVELSEKATKDAVPKISEDILKEKDFSYYYSYENYFVDFSKGYSLNDVSFDAYTILWAEKDVEVECTLYTYCNVQMYLNYELVGSMDNIAYKPIQSTKIKLSLREGANPLYMKVSTLGVRDTRNMFAICFAENKDDIKVCLPSGYEKEASVAEWLDNLSITDLHLLADFLMENETTLTYDQNPHDLDLLPTRYIECDITGKKDVALSSEIPSFTVKVKVNNKYMYRFFEINELIKPTYIEAQTREEYLEKIYYEIAKIHSIPRAYNKHFCVYPILARYHLGLQTQKDIDDLFYTLTIIDKRFDCVDFMSCGLVRFLHEYSMPDEFEACLKETMLNFRHWMDEKGTDGMCFWSENHSLMFFVTTYFAGKKYPDDIFIRSGKTGKELAERALKRIEQWVLDVSEYGYDEFYSSVYSSITVAALLNVFDYLPENVSKLAEKCLDRLFMGISKHTFDGVCFAPQGRTYRAVLYPASQDLQCLVNMINPKSAYGFSEWISCFATTKYKFKDNLIAVMDNPVSETYRESNAQIVLEKRENYLLTSTQSPPTGVPARLWENIAHLPDDESFLYVKSINECFHGTTQIEPGVYGYQQHLWYAALDKEACAFVNHPGKTNEVGSMRPGYWHGNGIIPAIKQDKNVLLVVYSIPEDEAVDFTHIYLPQKRFDDVIRDGNWIFAQKKAGYMAIYCSAELVAHNDQMFECEYRAYSRDVAYVCICDDEKNYKTLQDFMLYCSINQPVFDKVNKTLRAFNNEVIFIKHTNQTQKI